MNSKQRKLLLCVKSFVKFWNNEEGTVLDDAAVYEEIDEYVKEMEEIITKSLNRRKASEA